MWVEVAGSSEGVCRNFAKLVEKWTSQCYVNDFDASTLAHLDTYFHYVVNEEHNKANSKMWRNRYETHFKLHQIDHLLFQYDIRLAHG